MDKEDLPPKTVKAQLVRLDDNLKQIERTQIAGIQRAPGSLPVLEAFQLFLENERKVARQKLLMVTAGAVLAILDTMAAAGLYIRHTLRHADARTNQLAQSTAQMQQSLGTITERQQTSEDRLLQTARYLAAQRRTLATQSERLAAQQQAVQNEQQVRDAEIERLREQVESLLATQGSIQEILAAGAVRPSLRNQTQSTIGPAPPPIAPSVRRNDAPAEPPVIHNEVITLAPEGRAGVRWMLPTAQE